MPTTCLKPLPEGLSTAKCALPATPDNSSLVTSGNGQPITNKPDLQKSMLKSDHLLCMHLWLKLKIPVFLNATGAEFTGPEFKTSL